MPLLEMRQVTKRFGTHTVLSGLDLEVEEHQVVCLIGPSGCGKSTLLRCINGLEEIQGGEIRLHGDRVTGPGVDLDALRRDVGIVFQSFNLFPHMTVLENLTLAPIHVLRLPPDEAKERAMALLKRIGLDEKAGDKPGPVSIGAAVSVDAPEQPPAATPKPEPAPAAAIPDHEPKVQTRVAVIGDSDFAANGFLGISGNRDMFLNATNWLAQQENLIAIRPKEAGDRRVTMTAQQQNMMFVLSIFVIPAFVFGTGVYTWWRRR